MQNVTYHWSDRNWHASLKGHIGTCKKYILENFTPILYLKLLQNTIYSIIQKIVTENAVEYKNPIVFQKDGALRFIGPAGEWLNQTYLG